MRLAAAEEANRQKDDMISAKDLMIARLEAKQRATDEKVDALIAELKGRRDLPGPQLPAPPAVTASFEALADVSRAAATAAAKAAVEAIGQQNARAAATRPDKGSLPEKLIQKDLLALPTLGEKA